MSFSTFQEICEACYVSKGDVQEKYNENPMKPWSSGFQEYTDEVREADAADFMRGVFGADDELDLPALSERINDYRKKLAAEKPKGPVWETISNIRVAVAKAAADSFRAYIDVLQDSPALDIEEIRRDGKPSPYRNMVFYYREEDPSGGPGKKVEYPADEEAAGSVYESDMLALLIARQYGLEEIIG